MGEEERRGGGKERERERGPPGAVGGQLSSLHYCRARQNPEEGKGREGGDGEEVVESLHIAGDAATSLSC